MKKIIGLIVCLLLNCIATVAGPFHEAILDFESGDQDKQQHTMQTFTRLAQDHRNLLAREYVYKFFFEWERVREDTAPRPNEEQSRLIDQRRQEHRDLSFVKDWVDASWTYGCIQTKSYPGKTSAKAINKMLCADKTRLVSLGARGAFLHNGFSNFSSLLRGNFFAFSDSEFESRFFVVVDGVEKYHPDINAQLSSRGCQLFMNFKEFSACKDVCTTEDFHTPDSFAAIANFTIHKYTLVRSTPSSRGKTACQLTPSRYHLHIAEGVLKFFAYCGNTVAQQKLVSDYLVKERSFHQAFPWFDTLIETDWTQAYYSKGLCLFKGIGCTKDIREAVRLIVEAAKRDHLEAHAFLADYYLTEGDVDRSIEHSAKVLESDNVTNEYKGKAHRALGKLYLTKENTPENNKLSYGHVLQSLRCGCSHANFDMALLFYFGRHPLSPQPNYAEALKFARKVKNPDDKVLFFIANMVLQSEDNPNKYDECYTILKEIKDIPEALLLMGELLIKRLCSDEIMRTAPVLQTIFTNLLSLDKVEPRIRRAALFYKGEILFTTNDPTLQKEGVKLIRKAASQGEKEAISYLAHLEAQRKKLELEKQALAAHQSSSKQETNPSDTQPNAETTPDIAVEWDAFSSDDDDDGKEVADNNASSSAHNSDRQSTEEDTTAQASYEDEEGHHDIQYVTYVPVDAPAPAHEELSSSYSGKEKLQISSVAFEFLNALVNKTDLLRYTISTAIKAFSELGSALSNATVSEIKTNGNRTKIQYKNMKTGHTHVLTMHNPHGKSKGLYRELGKRMRYFLGAMGVDLASLTVK